MLKLRPIIRYDGIYCCKMRYLRNGLSYNSEHHPIHEVISYKYVRFMRSGQTLSLYEVGAPKKTFRRIREQMIKTQLGTKRENFKAFSGDINILSGTFEVYNDMVVVK